MKNSLQTTPILRPSLLLGDKDLHKKGIFFIRYRGCMLIKDEKDDERFVRPRYMDYLIPGQEHGLVDFNLRSFRGRFHNRIGMIECSEDDLHPQDNPFDLIIKVRNIFFFQAMIYARYQGNLFRLCEDQGPAYLSVNNETYYSIYNQVMKRTTHG